MRIVMLTTVDNPYNPIMDFDKWKQYDEEKGYFTCEYLARIVRGSDELSETDQDQAIENAIDEIVNLNILGIYKKIVA